jgi:hypothetical protein
MSPFQNSKGNKVVMPIYLFAPVMRTKYCSWLGTAAHGATMLGMDEGSSWSIQDQMITKNLAWN